MQIVQKMPELHTWEARHLRTTGNSHIGHCTRTSGSVNVKVRNIQNGKYHYTRVGTLIVATIKVTRA